MRDFDFLQNQRKKMKRRKKDSGDVWEKDFDFQRRGNKNVLKNSSLVGR